MNGNVVPGPASGGEGAVAYLAIVANAIKACGTLVSVSPKEFVNILSHQEYPLVVEATGGYFTTHYKYLTSYRGLAFHCKSPNELPLPETTELIHAEKMSIPDM